MACAARSHPFAWSLKLNVASRRLLSTFGSILAWLSPISALNRVQRAPSLSRRIQFQRQGASRASILISLLVVSLNAGVALAIEGRLGQSALWFESQRSGQGWVVEVLDDSRATLAWFTYDEQGGQRWLYSLGQIVRDESGERIEFVDLFQTTGGRFGPNFDPIAVQSVRVGEAVLMFESCAQGQFEYSAFGQSERIPVERIAKTMAAGCAPVHGTPGEKVRAYASQSGSWFDVDRNGEGFQLQWTSDDKALFGWYTYDNEGHQFWLTGVGAKDGDRIVFPEIYSTRGGRFGSGFDPEDVELVAWGRVELSLGCGSGSIRYASDLPEFGSGEYSIVQLTHAVRAGCPWVPPKLTDLYDIQWMTIPIVEGTPIEPRRVQPKSIADDGTVVGLGTREPFASGQALQRWRPGDSDWQLLTDHSLSATVAKIAPDGSFVRVTEISNSDPAGRYGPMTFRDGEGLTPLPLLILDRSTTDGFSTAGSRLVGRGRYIGELGERPWVWDAQNGQVELPIVPGAVGTLPMCASESSGLVAGRALRFSGGMTIPRPFALRWSNGSTPVVIKDGSGTELGLAQQCSADGRIVYGSYQSADLPQHPNYGQSWVWLAPDRVEYLGKLPEADLDDYLIGGASLDGTIAVGSYLKFDRLGFVGSRGFLWTQDTGLVDLHPLLVELGSEFDSEVLSEITISPSGRYILLSGFTRPTPGNPTDPRIFRAGVLHLEVRAQQVK